MRRVLGVAALAAVVQAELHTINVGFNGTLTFDPPNTVANVGDQVQWWFFAKNHSVVTTSFNSPCQAQANSIFSGFIPNTQTTSPSATTFTVTINDTNPIWFYCGQTNGDHCQKGMVGAINAPSTGKTLDQFREMAQNASTPSTVLDNFPVGGWVSAAGTPSNPVDVWVGLNGKLRYFPDNITATSGTQVTFHYLAKNHTVTQSSFQQPCVPREVGGAFHSGFVPTSSPFVPSNTTFTLTVNDTNPIWFYCAQTVGNHCPNGMVGSINAATQGPNTLEAFRDLAMKANTSTVLPPPPVGGHLRTISSAVAASQNGVVDVLVGFNGSLTFQPNNITALPGTKIRFHFHAKAHTVTQSTFGDPCHFLPNGFHSGFRPTESPTTANSTIFELTVNDTQPLWFYCAQTTGSHCQKGMVGAINAPATGNTIEKYIDMASIAGLSTAPQDAPLVGILIDTSAGSSPPPQGLSSTTAPLASASLPATMSVPPPTGTPSAQWMGYAGESSLNLSYPGSLSAKGAIAVQLFAYISIMESNFYVSGHNNMTSKWQRMVPGTVADVLGAVSAQAYVQASAAIELLQHFKDNIIQPCTYDWNVNSLDDMLEIADIMMSVSVGALVSMTSEIAATDPDLVYIFASAAAAKSSAWGFLSMLLGRNPSPTAWKTYLPQQLAYSYVHNWVMSGSCTQEIALSIKATLTSDASKPPADGQKRDTIQYTWDTNQQPIQGKQLYIGFISGPHEIVYAPVTLQSEGHGTVQVPNGLTGPVWTFLTNVQVSNPSYIAGSALAGPCRVWGS